MPPEAAAPDPASSDDRPRYAVGRVAWLTGIPVETLRMWERRYGQPRPERLPSGHRRYSAAQVARLRRVAAALARGERPGRLLRLDDEALERLLAARPPADPDDPLERWIGWLADLRLAPLLDELGAAWRERGLVDFLQAVLTPLLHRVGRAWATGRLGERHEHLLSQLVEDMLRAYRVGLGVGRVAATDRPLLLATLPGEEHGLGLQMLAAVCAEREQPIRLLGTSVPLQQLRAAAAETDARALAVSVSLAGAGPRADAALASLREGLPARAELLAGGAGLVAGRRGPRGVLVLPDLRAFVRWLEQAG